MVDIIMGIFKILVLLTGLLSISRHSLKTGVCLFTIAVFLSGMETFTSSATPWRLLLLEPTRSSWHSALLGGIGFLVMLFVLVAVVTKDILNFLSKHKM